MVLDLCYRRKGYLHNFPVGAFHLDTWSRQCLSGFHAANGTSNTLAIDRYDLNIVFAEQRLQGRQCFSDFHATSFLRRSNPQHLNVKL